MLIDRVVVNASPLICFFKSGLEELFPALFKDVVVPEAVIREVMAKGTVDLAAQTLVSNTWRRPEGVISELNGWPTLPLSTLHVRSHDRPRMTRGHNGAAPPFMWGTFTPCSMPVSRRFPNVPY